MGRKRGILFAEINGFIFHSNSKNKRKLKKIKKEVETRHSGSVFKIMPFGVKLIDMDRFGFTCSWKKRRGFSLWWSPV